MLTRIAVLALAAPIALAGAAGAQQPSQAQVSAIKQACRADYQRACASVPPGGSAAMQCLQQNAASLSAPCQQALSAAGGGAGAPSAAAPQAAPPPLAPARPPPSPRQELAVLRGSCGYDFRRFCSGVPLGGGRAISCLRAYGPRLSPRCRGALMSLRQPQ